jgi:hypothetical protein
VTRRYAATTAPRSSLTRYLFLSRATFESRSLTQSARSLRQSARSAMAWVISRRSALPRGQGRVRLARLLAAFLTFTM